MLIQGQNKKLFVTHKYVGSSLPDMALKTLPFHQYYGRDKKWKKVEKFRNLFSRFWGFSREFETVLICPNTLRNRFIYEVPGIPGRRIGGR